MRVGLVGFEGVDFSLLERVRYALTECYQDLDFDIARRSLHFLGFPSRLGPGDRVQYDAGPVATHLRDVLGAGPYDLMLAFTPEDLYAPGLNFVFGLANIREGAAVVSLHRLRDPSFGEHGEGLLLRRTIVEAAHELGHLLGLGHCDSPQCVMFFSNSILDTDSKTHMMCADCRRRQHGSGSR